jgi:hypothetical protein
MKTLVRQSSFRKIIVLIFLISFTVTSNGQASAPIKEFEITISQLTMPNLIFTVVVKGDDLVISKKIWPKREKDTILFKLKLHPTDTLKLISEINLANLKNYYSNNCIDDGSQINVVLKKDNEIKSVQLDNYYQDDIGTIIYFVNSLVPVKYKIWYDKERLISDYKNCMNHNLNKDSCKNPAGNIRFAARLAGRWSNGHFIAVML